MTEILARFKKGKLLTIYLVTVVVFFLVNLLVANYSVRIDESYGRAYTLSPATKKIIDQLDKTVTLKFFVSADLPTRLRPLKSNIIDLLNEYQKARPGRVAIQILDPQNDTKAQAEAKELGIPALQFSQLEQDKYAVTSSYLGVAINYGGQNEILPQVTDVNSLEYNLTAAIYKLSQTELAKVAIIGTPEPIVNLDRLLRQQFAVDYVDVSTRSAATSIDPGYKTVIAFDDEQGFDEQTISALKNYLQQKGRILFFADGVWVANDLSTQPAKTNLDQLLAEYGIKINPDLVLSTNAEVVNFGNSQMSFLLPYPFWLKTNAFETKAPYFSNINQLMFPWSSSIAVEKAAGAEPLAIIKTSSQSWTQMKDFSLDPQTVKAPAANELKQFVVAASSEKNDGSEILVVSSSRFVLDQYLNRLTNNLEFVLNVVNNFASGGALAGIRQRAVSFYPLPDLSTGQKDLFRYANILVLPIIFSLYGAYRLIKRR